MSFREFQRRQKNMLFAVVNALTTRPYLGRSILAAGVHVDTLIQTKCRYRTLAVLVQEFFESINERAGVRVLARSFSRLIDCTCAEELESLVAILGRLDKIARVAGIQNGQDISLDILMPEKVFCLVPSCAGGRAESSILEQSIIPETAREFEAVFLVVEDAMTGVVYNQEVVWPVVIADEIANVAV